MARVAQAREQKGTVGLRERFAAGHAHVRRVEAGDLLDDAVDVLPFAGVKCVFSIAVLTAQGTARQPYEYRAISGRIGLALQRMKNLIDAQSFAFDRFLKHASGRPPLNASRPPSYRGAAAPGVRRAYPDNSQPPATAPASRRPTA